MDSWYVSPILFVHLAFWGVQALGIVNIARIGMDKKEKPIFGNLKKKLKKNKKGIFESRVCKVQLKFILACVQMDSIPMAELTNYIGSEEKGRDFNVGFFNIT